MKISAVVSTFNNESVIEDCLQSLAFVDEIVVVDHRSSDKTAQIAKKFTNRIYLEDNDPLNIDIQKNFGFEKVKGEWVLSVDSDERITPELAREIKTVIESSQGFVAYKMKRKNIIFGKWIEHSLWWPDYKIRLFQKGKGHYATKQVHNELAVDGQVGTMDEVLIHHHYQSISEYLQKMDIYTENEALEMVKKNTHFNWIDAVRMPVRDFLKTFFFQEGYKDGFHGLVLSILQGFYMFLVVTKVWEKQGFHNSESENFIYELQKEWNSLQKEVAYWFLTSFMTLTKNPVTRLTYKILRRRNT